MSSSEPMINEHKNNVLPRNIWVTWESKRNGHPQKGLCHKWRITDNNVEKISRIEKAVPRFGRNLENKRTCLLSVTVDEKGFPVLSSAIASSVAPLP